MKSVALPLNNTSPTFPNIGVELFNSFLNFSHSEALNFIKDNSVTHFQITTPTQNNFEKCQQISREVCSVGIHSSFFSPLSMSHDWNHYELLAARLKKLNPIYHIEHFACLRDDGLIKNAICFGKMKNFKDKISFVSDSLNRYRDLISCELFLENIPVTEDVEWYYDFLYSVSERTYIPINLDIPHLLISAVALEKKLPNASFEFISKIKQIKMIYRGSWFKGIT